MEFNNIPNKQYKIDGKTIWDSRSVVLTGTIIIKKGEDIFVLVSDRGPKVDVQPNKTNIVGGYLDKNETGPNGILREIWEETGCNVPYMMFNKNYHVRNNDMMNPWSINTDPSSVNQNVGLRYGLFLVANDNTTLPELTNEHNDVPNETVNPRWINRKEIPKLDWAFNHDNIIHQYMLHCLGYNRT
jgi:8-oxo-dGTP pyrophosphatase MutT (NUDIX family)